MEVPLKRVQATIECAQQSLIEGFHFRAKYTLRL